jgi:hypothetical protein
MRVRTPIAAHAAVFGLFPLVEVACAGRSGRGLRALFGHSKQLPNPRSQAVAVWSSDDLGVDRQRGRRMEMSDLILHVWQVEAG